MRVKGFLIAAVAAVVFSVPAWAHHSHGQYNMTAFTTLKGTIKQIQWINPHTWVYLDVKGANGESEMWALEGASVTQLARRGWTKQTIKAGDPVTVRCHQLRDGTNGCLLGYVSVDGQPEKIFD